MIKRAAHLLEHGRAELTSDKDLQMSSRLGNVSPLLVRFLGVMNDRGDGKFILANSRALKFEFCYGGSLKSFIESRTSADGTVYKLSHAEVVGACVQLTSALHELHGRGVFHCDLHLGNVLLSLSQNCSPPVLLFKISDFNCAVLAGDHVRVAQLPGIPLIDPEDQEVTGRYDVFCLGLVLVQLLSMKVFSDSVNTIDALQGSDNWLTVQRDYPDCAQVIQHMFEPKRDARIGSKRANSKFRQLKGARGDGEVPGRSDPHVPAVHLATAVRFCLELLASARAMSRGHLAKLCRPEMRRFVTHTTHNQRASTHCFFFFSL